MPGVQYSTARPSAGELIDSTSDTGATVRGFVPYTRMVGANGAPMAAASSSDPTYSRIQGTQADGSTSAPDPVLFAGWDGANIRRVRADNAGRQLGALSPTPSADAAITPVVGVGVSGLLVRNSAGNFYGASVVAGATLVYLIAYNANSIPAAGATLTASLILGMTVVAASGAGSIDPANCPDRFSAGIVLLASTSTTTYTAPANLPLFLKGRAL